MQYHIEVCLHGVISPERPEFLMPLFIQWNTELIDKTYPVD